MLSLEKKDNMKNIMEEFKNFSPTDEDIEKISTLSETYKDKSEEDYF